MIQINDNTSSPTSSTIDPLKNTVDDTLKEWNEFLPLLKDDFDPVAYASDIMEKNTELDLEHARLIHAKDNVTREIQTLISQNHGFFLSLVSAFVEQELQIKKVDQRIQEIFLELKKWKSSLVEPRTQLSTCLNLVKEHSELITLSDQMLRFFNLAYSILSMEEETQLDHHLHLFSKVTVFKKEIDLSGIQLFDFLVQLIQEKKTSMELRFIQFAESKEFHCIRKGVHGLLRLGVLDTWQPTYLRQRQSKFEANLKLALEIDKSMGPKCG